MNDAMINVVGVNFDDESNGKGESEVGVGQQTLPLMQLDEAIKLTVDHLNSITGDNCDCKTSFSQQCQGKDKRRNWLLR